MTTTYNDEAALAHLDSEIMQAREAADAEAAFEAANGDIQNPWANSKRRLDDLESDRRQLALRIEGTKLSKAYSELQNLAEELQLAEKERRAADQKLKEHSIVLRWKDAGAVARRHNFGHSWVLYSGWILSGKSRYFAPECIHYFEQHGPIALRFNEGEGAIVRAWAQAKESADRALMKWSSVQDRRQKLLRDWPQLRTAS
jgi:hypothetical protein